MILIGGQVCYTHWAPYQMHMSPLQMGSAAAIDAELETTKASLATGARYFIGGHGGLVEKHASAASRHWRYLFQTSKETIPDTVRIDIFTDYHPTTIRAVIF